MAKLTDLVSNLSSSRSATKAISFWKYLLAKRASRENFLGELLPPGLLVKASLLGDVDDEFKDIIGPS